VQFYADHILIRILILVDERRRIRIVENNQKHKAYF